MSRKLPWILLTLGLLTACETASSSAVRYTSVPLIQYSPEDQAAVSKKIERVCGKPPVCPRGALMERFVLDYGKLREMVRAANTKESP